MTTRRRGAGIAGGILLAPGAIGLVGAALLAVSPGLGLPSAQPYGASLTVELPAGEHAVYVTPSEAWGSIDCTGRTDEGDELALRSGMTQQGLLLPERWDAMGSFELSRPGTLTLSCDGPVADGRFTVGPVVGLLQVAGAVLVAVLSLAMLLAGTVLVVVALTGRRRAKS